MSSRTITFEDRFTLAAVQADPQLLRELLDNTYRTLDSRNKWANLTREWINSLTGDVEVSMRYCHSDLPASRSFMTFGVEMLSIDTPEKKQTIINLVRAFQAVLDDDLKFEFHLLWGSGPFDYAPGTIRVMPNGECTLKYYLEPRGRRPQWVEPLTLTGALDKAYQVFSQYE